MTEIEKKALELVNEVFRERGHGEWINCTRRYEALTESLCRAIEQHEAFRQEVSDAVERAVDDCGHDGLRKAYIHSRFFHFIIAKPDPLVDAMAECGVDPFESWADQLRAALAKRGGRIVFDD